MIHRFLLLPAGEMCPIILMHMLGRPKDDAAGARFCHEEVVTAEVAGFLDERIVTAGIHGVHMDKILIDPGIGFGKTRDHNLQLAQRRLRELISVLGRPCRSSAPSQKAFHRPDHRRNRRRMAPGSGDRLMGTAATVAWSAR